jgi:prepilin-type N-terminal cleavage/methylation domain-containing protein
LHDGWGKVMRNQKGMTLIEIVVTLGVASIVLGVLGSFAVSTMGMFDHSAKVLMAGEAFEDIRATMTAKAQCTANLAGKSFSATDPAGLVLQQIGNFDAAGTVVSTSAVVDKDYRGLKVTGLALKPVAQVGTNLIIGNLEISFKKSSGLKSGFSDIVRVLPLFVRLNAGKITECWSKVEKPGVLDVAAATGTICSASSGGSTNTYDPVTGTCKVGNSQWIKGSLTSASCPAGMTVAPNPGAYSTCKGDVDGQVFQDPVAQVPVQLQNGMNIPSSRPALLQDYKNGACVCTWAQDLPASSLVGATCDILCVK